MAETAVTIIKDAFYNLQVLQDEAPLEASDARTAMRALNRMMSDLAAGGINLGYTLITKISDPITVPDGALKGVMANLAIELSPQYLTGTPNPVLVTMSEKGMVTMRKLGISIGYMQYPDTLPRGSGNDTPEYGDHFYPPLSSDILAEANGSITLEDATEV